MAGWSKSKHGLELKYNKIDQGYESNNVLCFDLDFAANDGVFDDCKDRLRSLFDQVIPIFLREVSVDKYVRPLPALLADGQPVDLFQLFCVVKKRGGFDTVSRKGLWGLVAEECELSVGLVASVKLIYIKYLKELDGWLQNVFRDKRSENGEIELFKKLDLLIAKLEELRGLVVSGKDKRRNDLKSNSTESYVDIDMGKNESHLSDGGDSNKVLDHVESSMEDGKLGLKFNEIGGYVGLDIGKSEFLLSDGGGDVNKLHDNVESSSGDGNLYLKFNETGSYIDLDIGKSGLLVSDGGGVSNKLHDNVDCNDDEKYFCTQGDIMLSPKCVVDRVISSQKSECCSSVEGDKVQDNIKTSRSDNNEKFGVQGDYDILLSAKSVVDKVVSCKQSGSCSWAEGDNIVSANNDDENLTDDYDVLLSARNFNDKVGTSEKRELNTWGGGVINEAVDKIVGSRKRKRESISVSEMLNWLTEVAKHPDDPAIGVIPAPSKWKVHGVEEFWVQALLAREALLIRRPIDAENEESSVQKKLKMHPSMYEDKNALHQSTERVRCSKRFPLTKSHFCSCCNPGPITSSKLASPHKAEVVNDSRIPTPTPTTLEVLNKHTTHDVSTDEPFVKQVSVGPCFQADVPEWTGVVLESDSKWLGVRMWPPEDGNNKTLTEKHPVGKGRQKPCDCLLPSSSGCVRFHIAEKRMKLKLELGPLFYRWRFDRMGEEVSLSWTTQEEERFKITVRQQSAARNKFWSKAFRLFPTRTREKLVGYYFNVLVLRRRIYQNRVTPRNIDSDDDETEFGSVGDGGNNDGSNLPICSMNMQCTAFE